jgi:predicted transcriptional regulator of viral defense system
VVRQHPEGLAPRDVRTLLAVDHDVRSTMKGLVRSGILTRREAGRYVVAPEGAGP